MIITIITLVLITLLAKIIKASWSLIMTFFEKLFGIKKESSTIETNDNKEL